MMPTFSNSYRVSPIALCPPGNLNCLILVTHLGSGRATDGCFACILRTAFTTCTLSLNSPAVLTTGPGGYLPPKYIQGWEKCTQYTPLRVTLYPQWDLGFLHSNYLTRIAISHTGVPGKCSGFHKSGNTQPLCPAAPGHVVHTAGTNKLLIQDVASGCQHIPQSGGLDPHLSQATTPNHHPVGGGGQANPEYCPPGVLQGHRPDMGLCMLLPSPGPQCLELLLWL